MSGKIDRISAYLLLKRHLKGESLRRARLNEILMERLGREFDHDQEFWAIAGMIAQLDHVYVRQNHHIPRGELAAEQAELEGASDKLINVLRQWKSSTFEDEDLLRASLLLTDYLLDHYFEDGLRRDVKEEFIKLTKLPEVRECLERDALNILMSRMEIDDLVVLINDSLDTFINMKP